LEEEKCTPRDNPGYAYVTGHVTLRMRNGRNW